MGADAGWSQASPQARRRRFLRAERVIKPQSACSNPNGCSNPAEEGGLCKECKPKTPASKHDYHREWKHLYQTKRWKDLRYSIFVRDQFLCQICKRALAFVVDHIVDHRGNMILFWDPKNLQSSCKPCHDFKTGSTHGVGRTPPVPPHLSKDGLIQNQDPKIVKEVIGRTVNAFDFLAALKKPVPGSGGSSGSPAGQ